MTLTDLKPMLLSYDINDNIMALDIIQDDSSIKRENITKEEYKWLGEEVVMLYLKRRVEGRDDPFFILWSIDIFYKNFILVETYLKHYNENRGDTYNPTQSERWKNEDTWITFRKKCDFYERYKNTNKH